MSRDMTPEEFDKVLQKFEEDFRTPYPTRIDQNFQPYVGPNSQAMLTGYLSPGVFGAYNPYSDKIMVNKALQDYPTSIDNTIGHEGQHRQYHQTMRGRNPRMSPQQYEDLLAGYYFDMWTGKKKHTYNPYQVGYSSPMANRQDAFPYKVKENYLSSNLSSSDYTKGMDGLLANMGGLEAMLPGHVRLEDQPMFKQQFPSKADQDYYYRVSYPMTNWLKSGPDEPRPRELRNRNRRENNISSQRDSLKNKILEAIGF